MILFLVGMMILVGALRDLGLFTWIVQMIVAMPNMTGRKFILTLAVASALLACAVDEVTSIIFIATLVFQVCNRLKLNPTPYLIICVLCTNVGSAGTMLGNPVGIYIGTQAGLTFHDFIVWAFPIMLVSLSVTAAVTLFWYRAELHEFDRKLQERSPPKPQPRAEGPRPLRARAGAAWHHHRVHRFAPFPRGTAASRTQQHLARSAVGLFRRDHDRPPIAVRATTSNAR